MALDVPRGQPPLNIPSPDPSLLTTSQIHEAVGNLRAEFLANLRVIEMRIGGVEKANTVFEDRITEVPTDVDKQVGHLKELHGNEITAIKDMVKGVHGRIDRQIKELEDRNETYARTRRESVAATFAASKELSDSHNRASDEAIKKAEQATKDQIKALSDIRESTTKALEQKIDDQTKRYDTQFAALTSRLDRGEGTVSGERHNRNESRLDLGSVLAMGALAVAAVGVVISVTSSHAPPASPAPQQYASPAYSSPYVQPQPPQVSVVPVVPVPILPK